MAVFSAETRAVLQQAGWSEDRKVDTSEYEKCLKLEGYPDHAVVVDFLARFGGLRVIYPHPRVPQTTDEFCINPMVAAAHICLERVKEDYDQRLGAPLCVIGEAFDYHMTLMMDSNGKVYAGYDDTLIHVGDSGIDAIEAICSGRHKAEVQ
ncbi:SUKH-3 domain-containing protein [Nostoc sp. CHAB 5836]|jgi:SUKH-3 immunity protein|uniref:SUKH-3 domain-containing protein n=1 Tax=Nostoc sp. CHAB 5836 TaxID=2780404 RepID=UPI001E35FA53|nr:SUKH-3 domain-containing protein [Nostoc sp. CHAB 5836]MCC5618654.1 SUKH-3 domain-containing protein [Nostoc sp. CHAB 5836]